MYWFLSGTGRAPGQHWAVRNRPPIEHGYVIRALIRLEAVYLLAIDEIAASFGNRLGFVSEGKVSEDFGVKPLIRRINLEFRI